MRTSPPTVAETLAALRRALAEERGGPEPTDDTEWDGAAGPTARRAVLQRLETAFAAELALQALPVLLREAAAEGRAVTLHDVAELIAARWGTLPKLPPESCWKCGYALAGLEDPRCPECGWHWGEAADPAAA